MSCWKMSPPGQKIQPTNNPTIRNSHHLCEPFYIDTEMLVWSVFDNNRAFVRGQRSLKLDRHQSCPETGAFGFLSCEFKE